MGLGRAKLDLLEAELSSFSKNEIESVITLANNILKEKYVKNRELIRGSLSPYITAAKFKQILDSTKLEKYRFIFYIMRKLALRVGEANKLNIKDIDLEQRQIFIPRTEKSGLPDICYLDLDATNLLRNYIDSHKDGLRRHQGFIFYPEGRSHADSLYVSDAKIREHFSLACKDAGLQICYGKSKNRGNRLLLYTTHSCRHSGITDFYLRTKDIVLTQKYARHKSIKSTLVYIHHTEEDMRKAIEETSFRCNDPEEFREFLKIYEAFKEKSKSAMSFGL